MDCIIDTSTLISLARIHFLELIPRLDLQVIFPAEVYSEAVIQGEEKGYADATVIKNFIKRHAIRSVDVKTSSIAALRRKTEKALPKGDEAVLALALKEKSRMVLTDDDGLGKIAFSLGRRVKAAPESAPGRSQEERNYRCGI